MYPYRKLVSLLLFLLCLVGCRELPSAPLQPTVSQPTVPPDAEAGAVPDTLLQGKAVILDPGHGFGDTGCPFPGERLYERDITPVLVQKIKKALEQDGVTVLLTHDGKSFPTGIQLLQEAAARGYDLNGYLRQLIGGYSGKQGQAVSETAARFLDGLDDNGIFSIFERSLQANLLSLRTPVSLFVSVHVNANESSEALNGFDLFTCADTPYAHGSAALMQALQGALQRAFRDRAARTQIYGWEDAFAVNKYPDMPSVLIESGYATNPRDASDLQNEAWQDRFARAVADGIELYLAYGSSE